MKISVGMTNKQYEKVKKDFELVKDNKLVSSATTCLMIEAIIEYEKLRNIPLKGKMVEVWDGDEKPKYTFIRYSMGKLDCEGDLIVSDGNGCGELEENSSFKHWKEI